MTPDALTNPTRLMLLNQGSGAVRYFIVTLPLIFLIIIQSWSMGSCSLYERKITILYPELPLTPHLFLIFS